MRILVANVNTTQSMTDSIAAQARSIAGPGTEIIGVTPFVDGALLAVVTVLLQARVSP